MTIKPGKAKVIPTTTPGKVKILAPTAKIDE
jgi:hypothetical protein